MYTARSEAAISSPSEMASIAARRPWRRIGTVVLALVLALGSVEVAARTLMYGLSKAYDDRLNRLVHPAGTIRYGQEGYGVSTWGPHGVRAKTSWKAGGIVCVGDSMTESLQVNDSDVFTARLERELNSSGAGGASVEVLNVGFAGFALADHIGHAEDYAAVFDPSWTIVQLSASDFFQSENGRPKNCRLDVGPDGEISVTRPQLGPVFGSREREAWVGWIGRTCAAIPFCYARYREYVTACERAPDPPLFFGAAAESAESADQPLVPIEAALDRLVEAYRGRLTVLYLAEYRPDEPSYVSPIDRRVISGLQEKGVSFVSTSVLHDELSESHRSIFGFANSTFGKGHLNAFGHTRVAELLSRTLCRNQQFLSGLPGRHVDVARAGASSAEHSSR